MSVDIERIGKAVREILLAVGEDTEREGLKGTPRRVADMYAELLAGMYENPEKHLRSVFTEKYDEIVLLRDIPFCSICEHHLMPFIGSAHVAYLPSGAVLGVSKLARIVDCFAHRLQVQKTQLGDGNIIASRHIQERPEEPKRSYDSDAQVKNKKTEDRGQRTEGCISWPERFGFR
jgi:GTP cyclohydrolase I